MKQASLTRNTTYYTAALTVQKILAFIYFWFISNQLFPEDLGKYVFALSFTTLFSIFIDLGLSPVLTREAAKDKQRANDFLRNVIGLKLPLAVMTIIAATLVITFSGKSADVLLLVYLAIIIMTLDSFSLSFWVTFRAHLNLFYESLGVIAVQIIIFTLGITALLTTGAVAYLMLALLAASTFNFILALLLLKLKLKFTLAPKIDAEVVKYFLKIIPAFALAGIFVKIYNTADSVLLSFLTGDAAVGFFAVPAKVVYAFQQVIPAAFAAVIFPAFSYYHASAREKLASTFEKAFSYLTIISLPLAAGLVLLAPEIINLVWKSYTPVIPTFVVMALAIPFIFLAFPTGHLLNATDQQRRTTLNRGIIVVLAVGLNIALIPRFSFFGTGVTFLITNVLLLFMDLYWVRTVVPFNEKALIKIVGKSLVATLVMTALILTTKAQLNLILVIILSMATYFVTLYVVRGITVGEIKELITKGSR